MPKVDLSSIHEGEDTNYPEPYARDVAGRLYQRLAPATGLTNLGMTHCTLKPGAWSSQRHWHQGIDEIVVMLEGEAVLVEDDGETILHPGDLATFAADAANGHHLVNRSDRDCSFVAIDHKQGKGDCHYPDIDMIWNESENRYTRRDGTGF